MVRTAARLSFVAMMFVASSVDAGNRVTWSVTIGDTPVTLPAGLFAGRALPVKGARWHCVADKVLRQDDVGNTFSTLTIECDDGETKVSSSASCIIGGAHDSRQLSFELLERSTNLRNAIRAECTEVY